MVRKGLPFHTVSLDSYEESLLVLSLVFPMQTLLGVLLCTPDLSKRGSPFSLWRWMSGAASLLLDICRGPV